MTKKSLTPKKSGSGNTKTNAHGDEYTPEIDTKKILSGSQSLERISEDYKLKVKLCMLF